MQEFNLLLAIRFTLSHDVIQCHQSCPRGKFYMRLPIGLDDFQTLIEENYTYVDKTPLAKTFLQDNCQVALITRPRRFGKTLNISMLEYFLSLQNPQLSAQLFSKLSITQDKTFCEQHQAKYPVIFFSLKGVKNSSMASSLANLQQVMGNLYRKHRYLLESNKLYPEDKNEFTKILNKSAKTNTLAFSLTNLINYLYAYYNKKVIVLIDEYDAPLISGFTYGFFEEMELFMRTFLGEALKGQRNLHKAMITGILKVAQANIFSDLNNINTYSLLRHQYASYFGFTHNEVQHLLSSSSQPVDITSIGDWYNGYHIGKQDIYNPWSIINCISQQGKLQPYWVNTSDNVLIKQQISQATLANKKALEYLLQTHVTYQPINENMVFEELKTHSRNLWGLLFFSGYLTANKYNLHEDGSFMCELSIPNKEIMTLYIKIVREWFELAHPSLSYQDFIQCLLAKDIKRFQQQLQSYINESGSYFDFNQHTQEQVYQALVLGMVVGLREHYVIQSNIETGDGRADVMLAPKQKDKPGIIIEFKRAKEKSQLSTLSKTALKQIRTKDYVSHLRQQGIQQVDMLAIAFAGKYVLVEADSLDLHI
jgi:hypothetical protein